LIRNNYKRELAVNEESKTSHQTEAGTRRLYRSAVNRRLAGVCGGLAEYFNVEPFLIRVIWVISIFVTHFATLIAYFVAWAVIPENPRATPIPLQPAPSQNRSQYIFGMLLIVLGFFFLADRMDWYYLVPWHWRLPYWFSWGAVFSVLLILFGIMLIFRPGSVSPGSSTHSPVETAPTTGMGEAASSHPAGEMRMNEKRLVRALDERMIGGVCGGLAKYLNLDPSLVRLGFVILTLLSGFIIGIVTYIVMMIVVPEESPVAKNSLTPISPV
jgi:phage shock protein PspC (stress-responsive transcriptional regulator)